LESFFWPSLVIRLSWQLCYSQQNRRVICWQYLQELLLLLSWHQPSVSWRLDHVAGRQRDLTASFSIASSSEELAENDGITRASFPFVAYVGRK